MTASTPDMSEFSDIAISTGPESRPLMSKPLPFLASMKFVQEVRAELGIDLDAAQDAADWVLNKMERFGARTARPVFGMDGRGPQCSWCSMIWPLCGHHYMSEELGEEPDDEPTA